MLNVHFMRAPWPVVAGGELGGAALLDDDAGPQPGRNDGLSVAAEQRAHPVGLVPGGRRDARGEPPLERHELGRVVDVLLDVDVDRLDLPGALPGLGRPISASTSSESMAPIFV
jgi:hypothetical protein